MKITRISPSSVQLTRLGLFNCYLVLESDGYTLVDTDLPGSADAILRAAGSLGAPIRRILLTHGHGDHVGSVDALIEKLGPIDLVISRRDARLLAKDRSLESGEPRTPVKGSVPGTKTRPTHLIEDGELYGSLRVIATPGHTPGHFSFLDERDGTLFTGDALTTAAELRVAGDAPWQFPLPNFGTWHPPTALASARRLLDYPIQRFAAGHGRLREGGIPLLRAAINHAASRA